MSKRQNLTSSPTRSSAVLHPKRTTIAPSIYDFVPADRHDTQRSIALEASETAVTPPVETASAPEATPESAHSVETGDRWTNLIQDILTPTYLSTLITTLHNHSSLPELVTDQLFQHLLKVYRYKVETTIQAEGLGAIDTTLPHFKLVNSRKSSPKKLEFVFNDDKIKNYLKSSLSELFSHAGFWEEFAKAIGANLIVWATENLEKQIGRSTLQAMATNALTQAVSQQLLEPDSALLLERISFFGQIYCQDITRKIVAGFDLPNCSLADMDKLLGLKQKPPSGTEMSLDLDPVAVFPTSIPIASSIRAQLRPDLWQQDAQAQAVFHYRSKSNPNNYIEHYITNSGDIAMLPWEAAEQIINKFGFDTVKLQLIFAARTMEENEPWNQAFTLKASDIIHLLGWDRNHNTSLPEKRNQVASTAYALSCMLVKSVWMEGHGKKKIDASTPIGRMWDVLIDPHGQIDWVTGKIEKPEEVYITVSPGLWTKHFLNRAGNKAKEALHQFGYLAKDILQIDPYHHEMALRLAIQLTLDSRIRAKNENPYDYRVVNLLEDVLPRAEIDKALQDKYKARDLRNR